MRKILALSVSSLLATVLVFGQSAQSSFFLDNYNYKYRINPAIMGDKSFIGFVVSDMDSEASSSLGVKSFFYPTDAGLVTAFNKRVSSEEFLSNIQSINSLRLNEDVNLFSLGIRGKKTQLTFETNVRMKASVFISRDYFAFLKNGYDLRTTYDLSNVGADLNAYVESAIGIAHTFGDKLNVGARLKFLIGAVKADANVTKADFITTPEGIYLNSHTIAKISTEAVEFGKDANGKPDFNNYTLNQKFNYPKNLGYALDLGATYEIVDGLTLSAAVTDLGFINWNYDTMAEKESSFSFEGLTEIGIKSSDDVEGQVNQIWDQFKDFADFDFSGNATRELERIPMTINLGATYELAKIFSVGALATFHTDRFSNWFDVRAGATFTPMRWISVSANAGESSLGPVCGFAASLKVLMFNIFIATESILGPMGKLDGGAYYPLNPIHAKASFGVSMNFGRRFGKFAKD